jgi:hypothetical protein
MLLTIFLLVIIQRLSVGSELITDLSRDYIFVSPTFILVTRKLYSEERFNP